MAEACCSFVKISLYKYLLTWEAAHVVSHASINVSERSYHTLHIVVLVILLARIDYNVNLNYYASKQLLIRVLSL